MPNCYYDFFLKVGKNQISNTSQRVAGTTGQYHRGKKSKQKSKNLIFANFKIKSVVKTQDQDLLGARNNCYRIASNTFFEPEEFAF